MAYWMLRHYGYGMLRHYGYGMFYVTHVKPIKLKLHTKFQIDLVKDTRVLCDKNIPTIRNRKYKKQEVKHIQATNNRSNCLPNFKLFPKKGHQDLYHEK